MGVGENEPAGDELRVLMHPARAYQGPDKGNLYVLLLRESLEERGVHVIQYSRSAAVRAKYDLIHLQFPEWFAAGPSFRAQARAFLRAVIVFSASALRRKPIVWTVHKVRPHGKYSGVLLSLVARLLALRVKMLILLSHAARAELERHNHPCRHMPSVLIPIGTFPTVADGGAGIELRAELGMTSGARLVAHLGILQAYKGVEALVAAFRRLEDPGLRLLIAGEDREHGYVETLRTAAADDERILLEVGRLPAARFESVIRAADLVVLPYRFFLHSGTAIHALSIGTPVLLPNEPAFRELRSQVGEEWVRLYEDALDPSDIERGLRERPSGEPDLSALSWDRIADLTIGAYRAALSQPVRLAAPSGVVQE